MPKKRKGKRRVIRPDEAFAYGPLRVTRYGRYLVWEADWPEDTFAEMQRHMAQSYPKVCEEIDELVAAIATLVAELPPDKLLHRAWWELVSRCLFIETEAEVGPDDAVAMRMVDYVQSVIASVKPAQNQRQDVSEEDWKTLRETVTQLFHKLNLDYQICRTAKEKAEDPNHDENVDEFSFRAQYYWCNVRGQRYQVHQVAHLRDTFLRHSPVMEELFGITAEDFINELTKIWHSLTFGIQEAFEEMQTFREDSTAALEAKLAADPSQGDKDLSSLMEEVIAENAWQERRNRVLGRCLGIDLCDVSKVTSLPQALIDELTWGPGEEPDFFAPGEFRGWPLRIWPIFKRPFIRLNGRPYCFDLHGLFDNIYRVMQRVILRLKPVYRETWNTIQREVSESLPFTYLQKVLPGATAYISVHYNWYPDPGARKKHWCETDGLLIYDDHLFIVEVRAGSFTYTSPANDFPAFIHSLKNLVLKPATQGKRFLDYLASAETISLFDKDHNKVGELRKADFRQITICTVTLDPFTEMAAQVQHLRKIGVDVGSHPVWAISIDDLRVYADIFENPLLFLHYVDQRMRAFQSNVIQLDDELDHLGLYLEHNCYVDHVEQTRGASGAKINLVGYRAKIDKFFGQRLQDPAARCPLMQEMPARILEVVTFLSRSVRSGRAAVSSYILDLDGSTRRLIADSIENELAAQPTTRRPKPFSTYGDVALTVFCYTESWSQRDGISALDHARAALLLGQEKRRLLLELSYTDDGILADVDWQWVERAAIPLPELARLRQTAEGLRRTRVAKAKAERGKIGRNEPCPCGSGKKYKKCCLNKQ